MSRKEPYENISHPLILELLKKVRRYESMRDDDLYEKNFLTAAASDEKAQGLRLAVEVVDDFISNAPAVQNEAEENAEEVEEVETEVAPESNEDALLGQGAVGSLFSSTNTQKGTRTAVDRIAVTTPPQTRAERANAIKHSEEIEVPEEFEAVKNPKVKKFIKDANDFYGAILVSKNKRSAVDVESITNPRQRAVAEEQRAMDESIGLPSYIVNEKYASLQINDLNISLPLNSPIDLSRYSAKRLHESRDLKTIISGKMVRFISPEEAAEAIERSVSANSKDEPKVYNSSREAERAMEEDDDDESGSNQIDLDVNKDEPSEQEELAGLIDLTPKAPQSGTRKTTHGGSMQARPQQSRPSTDGKTAHQQHKPIRPIGR